MKKLMVLAMVAALMLVAASPAFAQAVAIDEGDDTEFNAVAQNLIGPVGDVTQTQVGTATAVAVDNSAASASVSQTQDVSISQSNVAGNGFWWWL
ncbi:MAG TPA: hypothetical protein VKB09_13975 [Thermomicrobiales bacterium]|nr:hypothetical protein [Thermomicrobiales bacterium]